jgi:hypothetical protein
MADLLVTLVPLAIASAVLPVQLAVTTLLLQAPAGRAAAVAWVAGMTAVRLLQGLLFGVVFGVAGGETAAAGDPGPTAAVVQVILAILFYVIAAKSFLKVPDEDAPPPRWMTAIDGVRPGRAFLLGAGVVLISAKLWVFPLGAMGAIEEASLGTAGAIAAFLAVIVLAESIHLAILAVAFAAPSRADALLTRSSELLARYSRPIMIALGLVFGTWFLLKGLSGLGVI